MMRQWGQVLIVSFLMSDEIEILYIIGKFGQLS